MLTIQRTYVGTTIRPDIFTVILVDLTKYSYEAADKLILEVYHLQ
jgi:hypothetical protein